MPAEILYLYDITGGEAPREVLCSELLERLKKDYSVTTAHGLVPEDEIEDLPEDARDRIILEESVLDAPYRAILIEGDLRLESETPGRSRRAYADFLRRFIDERGGIVIWHLQDPFEMLDKPGPIACNQYLQEAGLPQVYLGGNQDTIVVDDFGWDLPLWEEWKSAYRMPDEEYKENLVRRVAEHWAEEFEEWDLSWEEMEPKAREVLSDLQDKRTDPDHLRTLDIERLLNLSPFEPPPSGLHPGSGGARIQPRVVDYEPWPNLCSQRFEFALDGISELPYIRATRLDSGTPDGETPLAEHAILVDEWEREVMYGPVYLREVSSGVSIGLDGDAALGCVFAGCLEWRHGFGCLITGNICDDRVVTDQDSDGIQFMMNLVDGLLQYQEEKMEEPDVRFESAEQAPTAGELIQKGEGDKVEFKSTLQWDVFQEKINKDLRRAVLKTIVAFLNTDGGTLIIGVEDDGTVFGLEEDLKRTGNSKDEFLQLLTSLINDRIGSACTAFIDIRLEYIDGEQVCIVDVDRSTKPAFLDWNDRKEFYKRSENTSRPLDVEETHQYIEMNWD